MDEEFKTYRKDAIRAAKDLRYGDDVVNKIKSAATEAEIQRVMVTARHKQLD